MDTKCLIYIDLTVTNSEQRNVLHKCPSYLYPSVCGSHWTMTLLDLVIKLLNFENQETKKILTWPKCIAYFELKRFRTDFKFRS